MSKRYDGPKGNLRQQTFRVYKAGVHPKPKRDFYQEEFAKRQQARRFCRRRSYEEGLTIVHPDGTEEKYDDC